ncbi:MAG: hypothetical protein V4864_20330 [Pseudomonadota bacterium]
MPAPHGKTKKTGDLHLPDVESDLWQQEDTSDGVGTDGTPSDRGRAGESSEEARPGEGNTRDSGERPR